MYNIYQISQTKSPESLIWALKHSIKDQWELIVSGNRWRSDYFPSHRTMSKQIDICERQSQRNTKLLRESGLILILPRGRKDGKNLTNKYVPNKKYFKGNFWTQVKKLIPALGNVNSKNVTLLNDYDSNKLQRLTTSRNLSTKAELSGGSRGVPTSELAISGAIAPPVPVKKEEKVISQGHTTLDNLLRSYGLIVTEEFFQKRGE